jgi:hypothetical protein
VTISTIFEFSCYRKKYLDSFKYLPVDVPVVVVALTTPVVPPVVELILKNYENEDASSQVEKKSIMSSIIIVLRIDRKWMLRNSVARDETVRNKQAQQRDCIGDFHAISLTSPILHNHGVLEGGAKTQRW